MKTVETVQAIARDCADMVGEGPIWSAARNAILWVDIYGMKLHQMALDSGAITSWQVPERIGWVIERKGRRDFIAGLKSGFAFLSLEPFRIEPIGSPEPDRPHNRLNDAKTDSMGRIWAGSMDDRQEQASGALYRLDPDLRWSRHDDGYQVANGPTFSPDGGTMYHADTSRRIVYAFPLDAGGQLGPRRNFLTFEEEWGYPDGMTTDSEGGIWIAHWGGARISRFTPDGNLDRSIAIPAPNVTSIVFAGPRLDRMFVTSAAHGCQGEPCAGALFEVSCGAVGCAALPFAG